MGQEFLCAVRARDGVNGAGEHQGRNIDDEALGVSKFVRASTPGARSRRSMRENLAPEKHRPGGLAAIGWGHCVPAAAQAPGTETLAKPSATQSQSPE